MSTEFVVAPKDKVLMGVSVRNKHYYLDHLVKTFERYDPGYDCELLIVDEGSTDVRQLKLLDKLSKKYKIDTRSSTGRGEGTWEYIRLKYINQYKYFFLMHVDNAFLRSNWLKLAVNRINDESYVEYGIKDYPEIYKLPVGKVGFQGYLHSIFLDSDYYLEPLKKYGQKIRAFYWFAPPLLKFMGIKQPSIYQLINDERQLWKNELLAKIDPFWNIEEFRKRKDTEMFKNINDYYNNSTFTKVQYLEPKEIYNGANWEGFQGLSEVLSCLYPYIHGYRTHCILGDGVLQEQIGYTQFWGLEYINHYGSHNFFKRMSVLYNLNEYEFRKRLNNEAMLIACDKIVKAETDWVEKLT